MKKTSLIWVFAALLALAPFYKAKATLNFDGSPDTNPNHFIWSIMDQMDAPDDPDCSTLVNAFLNTDGTVPAGDRSAIASAACNGIASMKTNMQSGMNGGGSESVETNLFNAADWHNVANLYFEHSTNGVADGRIAFSVPIDFMSYAFMNFMTSFGQNMESREGYISLDADTVGGFANYGAILTMYNIPDYDDPEILIDGQKDSGGVVSNLVYDRAANTLTFSAAHFSSFEVTEGSSSTSSNVRPRIDKILIAKYISKSGKERIRLTIKGDHFTRSTKVGLGGRNPLKKIATGKKITAFYSLDKLKLSGRSEFILKLKNGDKARKYGHLISIADFIRN